MIIAFIVFASALIYFSWKSLSGGFAYRDFFRRTLQSEPAPFDAPVAVFVPCRGLDEGLESNLSMHFKQDHPDYELVFVVDSESDPAARVISELIEKMGDRVGAKLVVAGIAEGESQKVHNLRVAVGHVSDRAEVFVFADSDVRPGPGWLRSITAPLTDEAVGCATGYRWFFPQGFSIASEMRAVWNASVASALGPVRKGNFSWGGSTSIRRSVFERLNIAEIWRGTLSDDFVMTRTMFANDLEIVFVPQAMCASIENCGFRELIEFTTRQMKITRVYRPGLWVLSFVGSGLFTLVMLWSTILIFVKPVFSFDWIAAFLTILLVSVFSIGKAAVRLHAVSLVLTEHRDRLRRQWLPQCTLWVFAPLLFLYNCLCALVSRRIVWRGITYELESATKTVILKDL